MKVDFQGFESYVSDKEMGKLSSEIAEHHLNIVNRSGIGNEFLGWVDLPEKLSKALILDIEAEAEKIRSKAEIYVVVGIGGSYLGSKAIVDALQNHFNSMKKERNYPYIIFAGQTLSEDYMADLIEILDKRNYCLVVVSKSGTTLEPSIAFRILHTHLENKYGKEKARERIIAVTDKEKGVLKEMATAEGYKTYVISDDIGGRFSVLTPAGLLPVAVAGYDIRALIHGAKKMRHNLLNNTTFETNIAWQYAAMRYLMYKNDKNIELMVNYSPNMASFAEWFKQLFGESEGKDGKGIFPSSVVNTTDLHSLGQYIQEGKQQVFETIIHVEKSSKKVRIPIVEPDVDSLNYILDNSLTQINHKAEEGTSMAHLEAGVPQIRISIDRLDEQNLGQLIYFFEFSCALSGYLLEVNPFNQPGVEAYKKNMFKLLGK